jgi:predicted alpha/beta-hydrolase family hydrolase
MADRDIAFLLAPVAGAPSTHPRMQTFASLLASSGSVHPFDYAYAIAGRKSPDRLPKLIEAHRAALDALRQRHDGPIILVGKSMGGRVGCHVALVEKVAAVVCLGYPLCGGGDPSKLRDEVLLALSTPALFVRGTRNRLCPIDLPEGVRRTTVPGQHGAT